MVAVDVEDEFCVLVCRVERLLGGGRRGLSEDDLRPRRGGVVPSPDRWRRVDNGSDAGARFDGKKHDAGATTQLAQRSDDITMEALIAGLRVGRYNNK